MRRDGLGTQPRRSQEHLRARRFAREVRHREDFKPAPEKIETRFGKLEFPNGYPTEETAQKVYDELDLQRATQLYLDMYPALSMRGMMIGTARDYGAKDCSHIAVTADRLDSSALFLTGNTESIYAMILFDLKVDGPTVFQAPPGLMGPVDDANFLFALRYRSHRQGQGQGREVPDSSSGLQGRCAGRLFRVPVADLSTSSPLSAPMRRWSERARRRWSSSARTAASIR